MKAPNAARPQRLKQTLDQFKPANRAQEPLSGHLRTWLSHRKSVACVTVTSAEGSTPRERGAMMLVCPDDVVGTIGGGRLEWDAVAMARGMLANGLQRAQATIHLGPAIGQCCGGRVTLHVSRLSERDVPSFETAESAALAARPSVLIHGAGHVGRALATALAPLPFRVSLIDSRRDELRQATAAGVTHVLTETPLACAIDAPPGAAHVVLTHSHALDSLIAATVMERGDFGYLGIIGSQTKRNSFRRAFRAMGIAPAIIARVACPIGGGTVKDKRPEVIAALTAAEITAALLRGG
jgi:xanthine dehydrogenase accessory factor